MNGCPEVPPCSCPDFPNVLRLRIVAVAWPPELAKAVSISPTAPCPEPCIRRASGLHPGVPLWILGAQRWGCYTYGPGAHSPSFLSLPAHVSYNKQLFPSPTPELTESLLSASQ